MTAFDIYSAIGDVDEKMLAESERPLRRSNIWIGFASAAAVVAVCTAAVLLSENITDRPPDISEISTTPTYTEYETSLLTVTYPPDVTCTTPDTVTAPPDDDILTVPQDTSTEPAPSDTETTYTPTENMTTANFTSASELVPETAIVPQWSNLSELEKYPYLEYNGSEYDLTVNTFSPDEVTFYKNGELYGIDEYTGEKHTKAAALYTVKNISEDYIIAIQAPDGSFAGFINHDYRPDSLFGYIEDAGITERYKFTKITSADTFSPYESIEYDVPNVQGAVMDFLISAENAEPMVNPAAGCLSELYIFSGDTKVITVYEGGYISIRGKHFNVGEDITESFISSIEEYNASADYGYDDEGNILY
ncbi:MAG: hypothetical protein ACI4JF_00405 [Oscillospiraceae bacterium]